MWNLKYSTNEHICTTDTYTENRLRLFRGWREGGRDWEFGISRCELLYIYIGWLKKQGLTVEHRELYSISCNKL